MGTGRLDHWQLKAPSDIRQLPLLYVGKGSDDRQLSLEHLLVGPHGADLAVEEEVEKERLRDVVEVMAEGELGAA